MSDTDKIKLFGLLLLLGMLNIVAFMGLGGLLGYERGKASCMGSMETDTVFVRDTVFVDRFVHDTITDTKLVPYRIYVHDTVCHVDSVTVELPMEWHHAHIPDTADVWYHGVMAGMDSLRVYTHDKVITKTERVTDWKTPRLAANIGCVALYSEKQVNPCLFGEVRWNAPKTTFLAFGAINHEGRWWVGGGVSYRLDIIR